MRDTKQDDFASKIGEPVGFIGLGVMGQPMALNLTKAGVPLVVWNRSPAVAEPLRAVGANVAATVEDVFKRAQTVILMLVNEQAQDAVLKRGTPCFKKLVSGHTIISMGSNAPDYSRALATDITAAGGHYVEAPVSGSRRPAETGQLVCMLGGDPDVVARVRSLLAPMCCKTVNCGPVGNALLMKLTVNLLLTTMLAGLAEAVHFADKHGLDLATLKETIDAGPMNCDFTRIKLPKFIARDFTVQAATADAYNSTSLIAEAARKAAIASPLLDLSRTLYAESVELGNGRLDMISVITAVEARTQALNSGKQHFGNWSTQLD